ncbi:MAG TPA: 4Fe-4S binding protein [Alphaproteobacteria bacterium]|nr:4Fe-4S binding protein [Alphaproteobacteria bacterium]
MAYKIDSTKCIGCGSCSQVCPAAAISKDGKVFKIDPAKCMSCGSCVGQCPVGAISFDMPKK